VTGIYVQLSDEAYQRIQEYANVVGKPLSTVVSNAITSFMEDRGDIIVTAILRTQTTLPKAV
jgi:predicted DNA-binding protein